MAYLNRFNGLDILITQITPFGQIQGIDPMVLSSLAGIVAVEAVTAYELAVKDIFEEFARKKNKVFGNFVKTTHVRLNGRIEYKDIKEMVKAYGEKYHARFVANKEKKTQIVLASEGVDLVQTYNNLVECRHQFVHRGVMTVTIQEAIIYYRIGKQLIIALDETMRR